MKTLLINTYSFESKVIKLSTRPTWLQPEPLTKENKITKSTKALVVLVHCEYKSDIKHIDTLLSDIQIMLKDTGRKNIILCPFGHLSSKLGPKETLLGILSTCKDKLASQGYNVKMVHFGSHKTLDWNWCGHPAAVRFRSYDTKQFYTALKYKEIIKSNPFLKTYEQEENDFIKSKIETNKHNTIIDIGAGYGRTYQQISEQLLDKKYIGIESNFDMYKELIHTIDITKNHSGYLSEFQDINIKSETDSCLLICMQNTLGVIEGDKDRFFQKIKLFLTSDKNNLIISVFKKEALRVTGLDLYRNIEKMVGEVCLNKSNIENGELETKNGYRSKWFSEKELQKMAVQLNRSIQIVEYDYYYLCYL